MKKEKPYVCVNCRFELFHSGKGYQTAVRRGKFCIVLEQITHTLFRCPKCNGTHFTREFIRARGGQYLRIETKKLKRRQRKRIAHLRRTHRLL